MKTLTTMNSKDLILIRIETYQYRDENRGEIILHFIQGDSALNQGNILNPSLRMPIVTDVKDLPKALLALRDSIDVAYAKLLLIGDHAK